MRATLSQRDQQRLNCIRDSRTAHKFSSQRRDFLLNTRTSAVIRRVFSFHPIFLASLYPSRDFTGYFRTLYHSLKQSFANEIDVTHNSRCHNTKKYFLRFLLKYYTDFNFFLSSFNYFSLPLIKYNGSLNLIMFTTSNITIEVHKEKAEF